MNNDDDENASLNPLTPEVIVIKQMGSILMEDMNLK